MDEDLELAQQLKSILDANPAATEDEIAQQTGWGPEWIGYIGGYAECKGILTHDQIQHLMPAEIEE